MQYFPTHLFHQRRSRPSLRSLIVFTLTVGLCFYGETFADHHSTEQPGAQNQILVLGDSISAGYGIRLENGWVNLLQRRLDELQINWRVTNASISGETTTGGLRRLPGLLKDIAPHIVIIELGGNDGLRGYPIPRIKENLTSMVDLSMDAGAIPVIVEMRIPPNYGPRYTGAFDRVFGEAAAETGIPLMPFLLEDVALEPGFMQADGIHPTTAAQPIMLDALFPYLLPVLNLFETPSRQD